MKYDLTMSFICPIWGIYYDLLCVPKPTCLLNCLFATGVPETDGVIKPFLTRLKDWGEVNYKCQGFRVRGICIWGTGQYVLVWIFLSGEGLGRSIKLCV